MAGSRTEETVYGSEERVRERGSGGPGERGRPTDRRKCLEKRMESVRPESGIRGVGAGSSRHREYEMSGPTHIHIFSSKKLKFLGYRIKNKNILYKEAVKLASRAKNLSTSVIFPGLLGLADPSLEHMASVRLLLSD